MLAAVLLAATLVSSGDSPCTMQAPPLETARIKNDATVQSVVAEKSGSSLSALLKDGARFRVEAMGCEHAGMQAAIWFDDTTSAKDAKYWLGKAATLSELAFGRHVTQELSAAIEAGSYTIKSDANGFIISVEQPDSIYFGIKARPAIMGSMLYVEYIYP